MIIDKVYNEINKLPYARSYCVHSMGDVILVYPASYEEGDIMYSNPLVIIEKGIVRRDFLNIWNEGYNLNKGGL